jgi:hypothetical protein
MPAACHWVREGLVRPDLVVVTANVPAHRWARKVQPAFNARFLFWKQFASNSALA